MSKKVKIHSHDLNLKVAKGSKQDGPEVTILNSKIDFNAQPEKLGELMKVLGIGKDVTVDVRVTTASTVVE